MTEDRKKLIARFQTWLDTNPRKELIASECANIAEQYHTEQSKLFGVGIELPTSKDRISALENSVKYWYDEKNNRDIKEFSKGFDNCYRWIKDYVRKQR